MSSSSMTYWDFLEILAGIGNKTTKVFSRTPKKIRREMRSVNHKVRLGTRLNVPPRSILLRPSG